MNRRNFFRLLTGAVAAPVLAPLAKLLPATTYTTYLTGEEQLVHLDSSISSRLRTYYEKSGFQKYKKALEISGLSKEFPLPENTGKTIKFYTYPLDKSKEV